MKRLILAFVLVSGWAGSASAQVDGWGWSIIIPSVTQTDVLGTHLRDLRREDEARDRAAAGKSSSAAQQATAPDPAVLRYTPSKARRTTNLSNFVAKSRQTDPAGAKSLEDLFAQGDIIDRIGTALAPKGFHVDNVADVYSVWWITAWQATRGRSDDTSDTTNRAVQAQAARALASTPQLAGASDASKQELAEALLIQSMLLEAAVDQAKGDPAQMKAVGAAAAQGARGMGLDMSAMELTETGFVQAKGG